MQRITGQERSANKMRFLVMVSKGGGRIILRIAGVCQAIYMVRQKCMCSSEIDYFSPLCRLQSRTSQCFLLLGLEVSRAKMWWS